MALSDDQKALLRLLAQREQGYDDIAALKGLSVDRVREEVRAALDALDAPPPEPPPPPPAPAPPSTPEPRAEPEPAPAPPAAPKPSAPRASKPRPGVPVERRRLLLFAGGALAIVAIVLGAIALFGGNSGSDAGTAANVEGTEIAAGEEDKVTQAVLTPPGGGDAAGRAVFGRLSQEEIVLEVTAENLEPSEKGTPYTVWLYRNPKLSLRVGTVQVGEAGELGARFPIPTELLAYVAGGAFNQVYVSRTSNAAYQREVARAKKNNAIPRYVGETVLSGKITGPIAKQSPSR